MKREELEQLAMDDPQHLELIFARTVAGFPYACIGRFADGSTVYPHREASVAEFLPSYLTDWTAVINAGKQAGMEMSVDVGRHASAWKHRNTVKTLKQCFNLSGWPDCAALMIVMIEVMET